MSGSRERDAGMDELLRTAFGEDRTASGGGACPDASDLAAFVEGTLPPAERTAIEAHAAACGACQRTLATLAQMPPVTPAKRRFDLRAWFPAHPARWIVPATGVAAMLVAYLAGVRPAEKARETAAVRPESTVALSSSAGQPPAPQGLPMKPDLASRAELRMERKSIGESATRPMGEMRLKDSAQPPRRDAPSAAAARQAQADAVGQRTLAASPAQTANAAKPTERAQAEGNRAGAGMAGGVAGGVVGGIVGTRPEAAASPRAAKAEAAPLEVVSPDARVRWKFEGGRVLRSVDGGATWTTPTAISSGDLLAASAPSPNTCWVVGRSGTVALTTDGDHWRLLTFPDRVDLDHVQALDARAATVRTSDGRHFATTDGGASWMPVRQ